MIAVLGGVLTALLVAVTVASLTASSYFRDSGRRESDLAGREKLANEDSQRDRKDAIEARRQAIEERDRSRRLSAGLALDRGLQLCQEGKVSEGLLWMAESLAVNPEEDRGFAGVVRLNLAAWRAPLTVQRTLIGHERAVSCGAYSPDGKTIAAAAGGTVSRRDALTGAPVGQALVHSGAVLSIAFSRDGQIPCHGDLRQVGADLGCGYRKADRSTDPSTRHGQRRRVQPGRPLAAGGNGVS